MRPRTTSDLTTALRQLSEALRLSREAGMGERALRVLLDAAFILWRQRSPEAAVLWGAARAAAGHLPRWAANPSAHASFEAELPGVDPAERGEPGRSLSFERAVDLALRVVEEELALAATAGAGGSEATGETPSIRSRGGRSQAFRER